MITIVDYGMGNLRSVAKAFELYHEDVIISKDPQSIEKSDGVILPGDGAFAMAIKNLNDMGWIENLKEYILNDGYFMGVCLGYQLLFSNSEEFGNTKGLDIIPGNVIKFKDSSLKTPHMGWNQVKLVRESKFLRGVPDESYFYFIHSFYPEILNDEWIVGLSDYGVSFPCVVGKGNVIATQFHPEKSHKFGLKIVENFVSLIENS